MRDDVGQLDVDRIQRLRERFLTGRAEGGRAIADYWRDERDLRAYDAVLAARIGWKWDAVLAECRDRGFRPPESAHVLDYGCGTGVAARRYVAAFGAGRVLLHDRSAHACRFAAARFEHDHPAVAVETTVAAPDAAPDVLLVSHVLSELDERGEARLEQLCRSARFVLIVESGNRPVARRLAGLRDRLRDAFAPVAPCPHAAPCPTLAAGAEQEWCHFFATPPGYVFTDGDWVRAARELQIDLRSLPYSFCALRRDTENAPEVAAADRATRFLGRARVTPRTAELRACRADGLCTVEVHKRDDAQRWRSIKKHPEQLR